jgi:superfamily II DNA or RNA helicase
MDFKPGVLVRVRDRVWVVLPSTDGDLIRLKPLDGSDDEVTGIYKPLDFEDDLPVSATFTPPRGEDLGDFATARLLFDAGRLSVRNASGPFRSIGKLSFRPRAYQMVPLIMALRQQSTIRLLIADDVGVGKTIEALIILKELLERGDIERFAIVAPPHLCDQWQDELRDKFGIEAVVIRSNTQARLDREIPDDTSVFRYYPFQVISIDYIKSPQRKQMFIQECPEFLIVDEAHTCSIHSSSKNSRQQRHRLIKDISLKEDQHLVLLTATPHSGKPEQFQSLLGLIEEKYGQMDLKEADSNQRRLLARHYVQRRRKEVERWLGDDTPFPERDIKEYAYDLSHAYAAFYKEAWNFTLGRATDGRQVKGRQKFWYWAALTLLQGIMSSPAAGVEMFNNRIKKAEDKDAPQEFEEDAFNPLLDDDFGLRDLSTAVLLGARQLTTDQLERMERMSADLERLKGIAYDFKAAEAVRLLRQWLDEGFNPVVFCTYIATAEYLGELLKQELKDRNREVDVQVVTGDDPDAVRRERVEGMADSPCKILVATDCLSEGINLQEQFNAVLHYDLPWNPNRLEQREGRVDRYGQQTPKVKASILKSDSNPIDETVFRVLLKKVREIHKSIGITPPFAGESILDAVLEAVAEQPGPDVKPVQKRLDFGADDPFTEKEQQVSRELEEVKERITLSRSIFAQHAIKAEEIETDLKEADQAIGSPEVVESFVITAMEHLGVQMDAVKRKKGYVLFTENLPQVLKDLLPKKDRLKVSFHSPTPEGYMYIGRNHGFVEQLCRLLLAYAFDPENRFGPARASVLRSAQVKVKTTLLLLRVRTVMEEIKSKRQLVAEEMLAWGYRGLPEDNDFLDAAEVDALMHHAKAAESKSALSKHAVEQYLEDEKEDLESAATVLERVASLRADALIDAHERFREKVGGPRYKIVEPVLPMDLLGMYVLLPEIA